jgi:hypothetical protein
MRVALLIALSALAVAVPAAGAQAPPAVGCPDHIEGDGPLPGPDRARDVVRGPLALLGAREIQRHRVPIGRYGVRLGILLAAGHEATIAVHPESREVAQLEYRFEGGRRVAEPQVAFRACEGDEPRFSGPGRVGPRTIWAGGLRVRRPGCVRLEIAVDGAAADVVRLPFGRPCRPPRGTRSVGCSNRSLASFPGAYSDPANLVVGPMTLVGGAQAADSASAAVIRELGWWKAPLLLRQGQDAVLSVSWESRRLARIGWASGPEGRAMRFTSCGTGVRTDSDVDTDRVTFWSGGFTLRRVPACVSFDLWWDVQAPAQRLRIPFGAPGACEP